MKFSSNHCVQRQNKDFKIFSVSITLSASLHCSFSRSLLLDVHCSGEFAFTALMILTFVVERLFCFAPSSGISQDADD